MKKPHCPKCDAEMSRRRNRESGDPFWGCSGYPMCRGTLPIVLQSAYGVWEGGRLVARSGRPVGVTAKKAKKEKKAARSEHKPLARPSCARCGDDRKPMEREGATYHCHPCRAILRDLAAPAKADQCGVCRKAVPQVPMLLEEGGSKYCASCLVRYFERSLEHAGS